MIAKLLYQRWLEFDLPDGVPERSAPLWSWPVPLSDGRMLLTLLYRPLQTASAGAGSASMPRTVIFELCRNGDARIWPPGQGYPAPVIFYANFHDELVGLDLVKTGKLYACRRDGSHLWTLEASIRMANLLAPTLFEQRGNHLFWEHPDGTFRQADLSSGTPEHIEPAPALPSCGLHEIHHAHTHLTRTNDLILLDYDPLPRITRYHMGG